MGARKEVYSPGMLTPSSAEQQGQISFQMEGNSMFALTEGSNNKTSQVKAAMGMAGRQVDVPAIGIPLLD